MPARLQNVSTLEGADGTLQVGREEVQGAQGGREVGVPQEPLDGGGGDAGHGEAGAAGVTELVERAVVLWA